MKLVIAGRPAWKYEEVEEMRNTMPYKEDVRWVGYMNVDQLSKVIGGAYALIYASLFEGFGIPILEALQCDVPAIVSNTSSMPEVAGDAALLVDPQDAQDIAAKMHLLYKDEALRKKLIDNARIQIKKFDWDSSAQKLWNCMMQCIG
jgi:glycosyltransferase involved in cell wall biosynthesis